jgi:hypothetical protein
MGSILIEIQKIVYSFIYDLYINSILLFYHLCYPQDTIQHRLH